MEVAQSCLTPCNLMDCSLPGSSVHWILQAKILEWVVIPFSREFSQPSHWTRVSCFAGRFFTIWDKFQIFTSPWLTGRDSLVAQLVKSLPAMWETWVGSLGWQDPRRRKWPPTPVFLPGKFHGWRSLVDYSPWGC